MSAAPRTGDGLLSSLFGRSRRRSPEPDETGYLWSLDTAAVRQSLHSPNDFVSARGDVDRLAEDEVRRQFAEAYEGLPGTRGGLVAASIGAATATAFFAVMGTLWSVLPAVLAVVFTSVFIWASAGRRPASTRRRAVRTRD